MSRFPLDPEITALEALLAELVPAPSRLDRDRLMYQAGARAQRSLRRGRWAWPALSLSLAVIVATQSLFLASRPAPPVVDQVVFVREPGHAPVAHTSSSPAVADSAGQGRAGAVESSSSLPHAAASSAAGLIFKPTWESLSRYGRLEEMVIRFGLDALAEPSSFASQSAGPIEAPSAGPGSAGALKRLELQKLLDLGGSS